MSDLPNYLELLSRHTDEVTNALSRILALKLKDTLPPLIGTIDLFLALRSCRGAHAKVFLSKAFPQRARAAPANMAASKYRKLLHQFLTTKVDTSEYKQPKDEVFTTKAIEVIRTSTSYAKKTEQPYASAEHLLLALIEVRNTTFFSLLKARKGEREKMRRQLIAFLGLESDLTCLPPNQTAYSIIYRLERALKEAVISSLKKEFRGDWWIEGVPQEVRKSCAQTREEDKCRSESEAYMYLIDFKKIMSANWKLCGSAMLRATRKPNAGKDKALSWMDDINPVRNAVMHPSRRGITPEDLEKLRDAHRIVNEFAAHVASEGR